MLAGLIYVVFGIIETVIALRFVLLFLGANSSNGVVSWVYSWSEPFVAPIAGILGQHITVAGQGVVAQTAFDWTALIALVVYAVIGGLLARLVSRF